MAAIIGLSVGASVGLLAVVIVALHVTKASRRGYSQLDG